MPLAFFLNLKILCPVALSTVPVQLPLLQPVCWALCVSKTELADQDHVSSRSVEVLAAVRSWSGPRTRAVSIGTERVKKIMRVILLLLSLV